MRIDEIYRIRKLLESINLSVGTVPLATDSERRVIANLGYDSVGIAREETVRDIASRVTSSGNFRVAILEDGVGLAKNDTVSNILDTVRLGLYDSKNYLVNYVADINSRVTSSGNFRTAIVEDLVDLAKDATLSNVLNVLKSGLYDSTSDKYLIDYVATRLPSLTSSGNFPIAVAEDDVGLLKSSDVPKTSSGNIKIALSEDELGLVSTVSSINTLLNDTVPAVANDTAKLGNVLNINQLGLFKPYSTVTLTATTYSAESLPNPPIHPPNLYPVQRIYKLSIASGDTVRIIYPFMVQAIKPYVCYVTFYPTVDIDVKAWIAMGDVNNVRNKWCFKDSTGNEYYFKYSANSWNRLCLTWTGEFHWGQPAYVLELYNSSTSTATVYVSPLYVSLLDPEARGVTVLYGSESGIVTVDGVTAGDTYTLHFDVPIRYVPEQVEFGMCAVIAGDGTNSTTLKAVESLSGATILDVSNSSTTSQLYGQGFAVWYQKLMNLANVQMLSMDISFTPYGTSPLNGLMLYYYGVSGACSTYYSTSGTVNASSTVVIDGRSMLGHFLGFSLSVTTNASATGTVDIYVPSPMGEMKIASIGAGQTNYTVSYSNRVHYVKIVNTDTTYSASYSFSTYSFIRALLQ